MYGPPDAFVQKALTNSTDARLNLRLSGVEKFEIERTAKALDMTVTAYLLAVHRISREVLESKGIV